MRRPKVKKNPAKVYLLEECVKWEGNEVKGVFASPELAMESIGGVAVWHPKQVDDGTYWTTHNGRDGLYEWFVINEYDVQGGK